MKQMIPKEKQRLCYVRWQDAHCSNGWFDKKQIENKIQDEAWVCEEVGWVVYEDKKELHLCARRGTWDAKQDELTNEYGLYQRIPTSWIFEKKEIRLK